MKLGRFGGGATALDQRGFALIAMLALAAMITAFLITIGINRSKAELSNEREDRNIAVLRQAKAALITYAASEQWQVYRNDPSSQPGGLPCPDTGPDTLPTNTGVSSGICPTADKRVGRLPFATIGTDDLRDASGERLWYAISSNFYRNFGNNVINSDTQGLLTVTGNAPATNVVAIVFAPGPPVQDSLTGLVQDRSAASYNRTASYLEGYTTVGADYTFASSPPPPTPFTATSTFNDRLLVITQAELMAAVEPVVAARIERTVKPILNTYLSEWGAFPFPALFDISGSGPGDDTTRPPMKFLGIHAQSSGLLPIATVEVTAATNASPITITTRLPHGLANSDVVRISGVQGNTAANDDWTVTVVDATHFRLNGSSGNGSYTSGGMVMWPYPWSSWSVNRAGGSGRIDNDSCSTVGAPSPGLQCQFRARDDDCGGGNDCISNLRFQIQARVGANAGRSLAKLPAVSAITFSGAPGAVSSNSIAGLVDSLGIGTVTYTATLPGAINCNFCPSTSYNITVTIPNVVVNSALNSSDPNVGWFIANEWYRQIYYALAPDLEPGGNSNCASNPPCLTVKNLPPVPTTSCTGSPLTDPCRNTNKQALFILAGRALNGSLRPSSSPNNYLEGANQTASTTNTYEHRSGTPSWINDRVVVVAP